MFNIFMPFKEQLKEAQRELEAKVPSIGTKIRIISDEVGGGYHKGDITKTIGRVNGFAVARVKNSPVDNPNVALVDEWYEVISDV